MALVIKIAGFKSEEEGLTLYKDALVNEGTLLLHDYSNKGNLRGGYISHGSPFYDLASDVSNDKLGVDNFGTMHLPENLDIKLTDGKGLPMNDILQYSTSASDEKGVNMGNDLSDYLFEKQPRTLALYWVRSSAEQTIGSNFLSSGSSNDRNLILNTSTTAFQASIAGGSSGSEPLGQSGMKLVQYAVEFNGTDNRRFVNGVFRGGGSISPTGFISETRGLLLGARTSTPSGRFTDTVVYRIMIVDLDKSELTAEQIVKKDWEYCNGIGEFAGLPTKRPFIDTV